MTLHRQSRPPTECTVFNITSKADIDVQELDLAVGYLKAPGVKTANISFHPIADI